MGGPAAQVDDQLRRALTTRRIIQVIERFEQARLDFALQPRRAFVLACGSRERATDLARVEVFVYISMPFP